MTELPQGNCASESPSDNQRYAVHDVLWSDYTRVLEAGGPRAGYERYLYVFGAHWQEHTANGFESYLDNYMSADMGDEVKQYRALLTAIGAEVSVRYLDIAVSAFESQNRDALDSLPIDYGDEEDAMYLAGCYFQLHREALG